MDGRTIRLRDSGLFCDAEGCETPERWTKAEFNEKAELGFLYKRGVFLCRERAFDYAAARVPDYWVVNPYARAIEIFREPIADLSSGTGFRYAVHRIASEAETLFALAMPGVTIKISDMLDPIE